MRLAGGGTAAVGLERGGGARLGHSLCEGMGGPAPPIPLSAPAKPPPLCPPVPPCAGKAARAHITQTQPFQTTFGKKQTRKRPKLGADSYSELVQAAEGSADGFVAKPENDDGVRTAARDSVFEKGQSRRIWGELYKVVDSSDVIIQVGEGRGAGRRLARARA